MEDSLKTELCTIATDLYKTGPSQSMIWSRSGGDVSFLFVNQIGRDAWYEAIELLANGGGGSEINPGRFVEEMLKDFPVNQSLLDLRARMPLKKVQKEKVDQSELTYKAEDQPWFTADFSLTIKTSTVELESIAPEIEVVILTATEVELKYALSYFQPLPLRKGVLKGTWESGTYYVGKFGSFNAVLTKCEMGLSGADAAILTTEECLRLWKPTAAFMVGIAFAKDSEKQHIGQVLVAKSIIPYDNQRVGDVTIYRGTPIPSDITLLNRFEHSYDWKFTLPDGSICKKDSGPILSGEKLVDNLIFRDDLFEQFSTAIGGEMEGAGFYAVCQRKRIPCLLLKSICDWGDGKKHKKRQALASASACSLLHYVLSHENSL